MNSGSSIAVLQLNHHADLILDALAQFAVQDLFFLHVVHFWDI